MAFIIGGGIIIEGGISFIAPPAPAANDPYFNLTTLLLPGNGTNNANNNTFVDSSVNNFTITRFGNTTQGTFSPYGTLWSNYFDGAGDYLTAPNNAALQLGSSDFTAECWVFPVATPSGTILYLNGDTGTYAALRIGVQDNTVYLLIATVTGSWAIISGLVGSVPNNAWSHIAVTRSGTTVRLFVNGGIVGTYSVSGALLAGTINSVGAYTVTPFEYLQGYVSNLRIVKGTALYTANFTPSTTPLTAVAGTSLLTCADNRFIDDSTNNFAITRTGNVLVTNFSPFIDGQAYSAAADGGSMYLDGTGDYITAPGSINFQFPGDFTIEGWMYFTNTAAGSPQALFSVRSGATEFDIRWFGSRWQVSLNAGSGTDIGSTPAPVNNAWTHVACVRSGSSINLYVNGVKTATTLTNSATLGQSAQPAGIGSATGGSNTFAGGYLSDVRVINGQAVYTSNFVPPLAPLLPVTNTVLLVNGTNAGITDATTKTVLETFGDAKISSAVSQWGGSSISLDGTGDYLKIPTSAQLDFGTGDFTIETWVNFNALTSNRLLLDRWASGNANSWQLYWRSTGTSMTFLVGASTVLLQDPNASNIVAGTWNHVAVTRSGTTVRLFVNGIVVATATSSLSLSSTIPLAIGMQASTVTNPLNGYLQDVRITKGVARYTANFALPTAAFPLY